MKTELEEENARLRKFVEQLKVQLARALEAVAAKHLADKSKSPS